MRMTFFRSFHKSLCTFSVQHVKRMANSSTIMKITTLFHSQFLTELSAGHIRPVDNSIILILLSLSLYRLRDKL